MRFSAIFVLLAVTLIAEAATTQTWEMNGYDDFLAGRMEGLSITSEGRLVLAPETETVYTSDQPEIWSIARAPEGSGDEGIYLGTGDRGRLFRLEDGEAELLWTAPEPEIFALAVEEDGVVYAGTSPNGKIYRIEDGEAEEYYAPEDVYIWSLVLAPNGDLFVGTGDQGRVYRVTDSGEGELYYETGQSHVTALARDPNGNVLAGTEPNGILYRIAAQNDAFVLYDANLPEIRSILLAEDGSIYTAALGGGVSRQATAAYNAAVSQTQAVSSTATSITVAAQGGIQQPPQPQAATSSTSTTATSASVYSVGTDYLAERSALYRIYPDNRVEKLWSSNRENIYDVAFDRNTASAADSLLLLTDVEGRIYRLEQLTAESGVPVRQASLVTQTNQGDATRLLSTNQGTLAATGHAGEVFRLGQQFADEGWFESPVHDAGTLARWGRISWRTTNGGNGVRMRTRTGNSARPDATWSPWSDDLDEPGEIESPNARYIQWRAEFRGNAARNAAMDNVTIAYLPQNTAPEVRSLTISAVAPVSTAVSGGTSANSGAYSITVSASGGITTPSGTASETFSRPRAQRMQISWAGEDADGDNLLYSLYFRGEGEAQWKPLTEDATAANHIIEGDALADGRYLFRVVASDQSSNPVGEARAAELIGPPILIDNTPPEVTTSGARRNGNSFEVNVEATDATSVLRRAEYSVDAGPWTPVEAADGVTDSRQERFELRLPEIPAGEHLITIRVLDAAGNAGLARAISQ